MEYKGYQITVSSPEKLPNGKRRGVLDVHDPDGNLVKIFTYTIRNWLSLTSAKAKGEIMDKHTDKINIPCLREHEKTLTGISQKEILRIYHYTKEAVKKLKLRKGL